jgi:O-antigen/teichoic acid export membrane protein
MLKLAIGVAVGAQIGAWYGRVDLIFVERALSATQLGQYSVPLRALDVAMGAAMTLGVAMLPMLARAQAAGLDALVPRLTTVLRFGLLLFLPAAGLVSMLAPELIGLFPVEYAAGDVALRILIWVVPAVFCETMLHWVLFFCGRGWQPAITLAIALAVNTLGCALLVPRLELAGAATARLTAELSIVVISAILVHRVAPLRWLGLVGKPLLMAAVMAAGWLACPGSSVMRAIAALFAYGLAGLLIRPLELREWALVKGMIRRQPEAASDLMPPA